MRRTTRIGQAKRGTMSEAKSPRTGANAAAQTIASAGDRVRAFRQARRHSYLVRAMKLLLPCIAVVAMAGYGAVILSVNALKKKGITSGPVTINPQNLTMETPKYDGFSKDGSHYEIRAREAITDLKQTGPVRLNVIDGDITQPTGVMTYLKANWGTYDQKKDVLELYEKVDIDGSTGMKARLTRATVHTKESRIISDEPIYAETDTGNIRARSMAINSKARQATFKDAGACAAASQPAAERSRTVRATPQSPRPQPRCRASPPIPASRSRCARSSSMSTTPPRPRCSART